MSVLPSNFVQNVFSASTYLREAGSGDIFYIHTHLYLLREKINPKLPMRKETGYGEQQQKLNVSEYYLLIDSNLELC